MPTKTSIEWADYSTNPLIAYVDGVRGWSCAKVSPECLNCYSEAINARFGHGKPFNRATTKIAAHHVSEPELRKILTFRPAGPFKGGRWRPAVFPCDMTDIFGEWVTVEMLDQLIAVFALRPDVDFLILTKRAQRMQSYFADPTLGRRIYRQVSRWLDEGAAGFFKSGRVWDRVDDLAGVSTDGGATFGQISWRLPLANLWLGVSGGRQDFAEKRLAYLYQTPAAVRFLSAEPLIAPLNFLQMTTDPPGSGFALTDGFSRPDGEGPPSLDWVIVGGESGRKSRPCDVSWIRSIVGEATDAGVAVFVKQLGANVVGDDEPRPPRPDGKTAYALGTWLLQNAKGADPSEWPADLRRREWPRTAADLEAAAR